MSRRPPEAGRATASWVRALARRARSAHRLVVLAGAALLVPLAGHAVPNAQTLASDRACFSCHGLVRKQVGPGFAQVAERYRGDATAAAKLTAKIRAGSVGTWGRVIMPAQTQVTEAEAATLAAWVLSQPSPP